MAANVNKWSETPASNATADPAINWAEGQAPSTVNDSARQMMAAIAADRDDTRGSLTFGGTSAALTLTTNSGNATYQNGMRVSGKLASAFTANATLNVDSIGAKNIYRYNNAGAGQVQAADGFTGQHVTFEYEAALNSSAGGWVLLGEPVGRVVGVQILTVTGTYTRNPAASTGDIIVQGGGAGSGGAGATSSTQIAMGPSAGSGGWCASYNVALPATATVTIGAAGTAGTSAPTAGGNGGTTSFVGGAINMSASGAPGGAVATLITFSGATTFVGPQNGGVPATGGQINSSGKRGTVSLLLNGSTYGGTGGDSIFGSGGGQSGGTTPDPTSYGAGAQPAVSGPSTAAKAGSVGIQGAIIVVERA